jgi:hypothetical protein
MNATPAQRPASPDNLVTNDADIRTLRPTIRRDAASASVLLPGRSAPLVIEAPRWAPSYPPPTSRRVYAAAHVAATPDGEIDWYATLAFRDHLWDYGFGVAEAMDTAQRGGGLTWDQARDLITRSATRAAIRGSAVIACGAGTDHLGDGPHSLADIIVAYREQVEVVQDAGADVILMASRALAASAHSAEDYLEVYTRVLGHTARPVMLHWLGPDFDPALRGYWGSDEFATAADTVIELIGRADGQVSGIKLSLLDADKEVELRRRLPPGTRMFTGDDFNYADLIRGNIAAAGPGQPNTAAASQSGTAAASPGQPNTTTASQSGTTAASQSGTAAASPGQPNTTTASQSGTTAASQSGAAAASPGQSDHAGGGVLSHSDALLGAFAAITAPAAAALHALDDGDVAGYDAAIGPTVPLSRTLFEHPTSDYKAGVAFLAWLNGLQPHFAMLSQMQYRRSPAHLIRVFELAAAAGALTAPNLAAERMTEFLTRIDRA